jgi:hypothetical protein
MASGTPAPPQGSKHAKAGDGQEEDADEADEAHRGAAACNSPHPKPSALAEMAASQRSEPFHANLHDQSRTA